MNGFEGSVGAVGRSEAAFAADGSPLRCQEEGLPVGTGAPGPDRKLFLLAFRGSADLLSLKNKSLFNHG